MRRLTRRRFIAGLAAGAAGAALGGCEKSGETAKEAPRIRRYAALGDTGIEVSDVIFGAGALHNPAIVRDRAVIITKQGFSRRHPADKQTIARTLERSLRRLQTDYVDGLFIHSMDTMEALRNDDVMESFIRFKEQGKVRFTGFSTHNERTCLAECVKPRYDSVVDAVMFRYNHMEGRPFEPMVAAMRRKGIGTIAMKTLAGGKQGGLREFVGKARSYEQAAIGWVLANRHIDCAVMSMDTFSLVDDFVAASGMKLERDDLSLLHKYRDAVDSTYCRVTCNVCESACPHGVAISDVMRCEMYYRDYGHEKKALATYAALPAEVKPAACRSCAGDCAGACPHKLPVRDRLLAADGFLTA